MTDASSSPFEQVTVTGQLPAVVRVPTLQVQEAVPVLLASFGPRPAALEGPDLYSTAIVQEAPGAVVTFAVANAPGLTGEVSDVNANVNVGGRVGSGVGASVGAGVMAGGGIGVVARNEDSGDRATALEVGSPVMAVGVPPAEAGPRDGAGKPTLAIAPTAMRDATTTVIR